MLKYRVIETPEKDVDFLSAIDNLSERLQIYMPSHWPLVLADGQESVRHVRRRAAEFGIRTDRMGLMGFSAGAHLAVGVTLANEADSRPNFVAPIYGSGDKDIVVPADAPPLFMAFASDDSGVVKPCMALHEAWLAAGRSAELHCYAQGGHGFGMIQQGYPSDRWIERFYEWLKAQHLLN